MLFYKAESFSQSVIVFSYIASIVLVEVLILLVVFLFSESMFLFILGITLSANTL